MSVTGGMRDAASLWSQCVTASVPLAAAVTIAAIVAIFFIAKLLTSGQQVQPSERQQEKRRNYTSAEVAQHNEKDSLWIILKGKVYDVTPYVDEHPGGSAIFRHGGQDATAGFFGPQHPERVFDLIDDFYIGDLVE